MTGKSVIMYPESKRKTRRAGTMKKEVSNEAREYLEKIWAEYQANQAKSPDHMHGEYLGRDDDGAANYWVEV